LSARFIFSLQQMSETNKSSTFDAAELEEELGLVSGITFCTSSPLRVNFVPPGGEL
jgi:hypothetical protein